MRGIILSFFAYRGKQEAEGVKYYILVYPEELLARVYKLEDDKYKKLGEFSKEKLEFSDIGCALALDFGGVFKRIA